MGFAASADALRSRQDLLRNAQLQLRLFKLLLRVQLRQRNHDGRPPPVERSSRPYRLLNLIFGFPSRAVRSAVERQSPQKNRECAKQICENTRNDFIGIVQTLRQNKSSIFRLTQRAPFLCKTKRGPALVHTARDTREDVRFPA